MTYIFDHIFKTAGTTFHSSYLPAAFDPKQRFVVRGLLRDNAEDLKFLMELPQEEKQKLRIIAGHFADWLRPYFPNAKLMTLIRHPIDRAVSAYLHAKYHEEAAELVGNYIRESNVTLSEFVENNVQSKLVDKYIRDNNIFLPGFMETDLFANSYANFVSMQNRQAETILGPWFASADISDVESIREKIRSRFILVGYSEQFELFLFFLHRAEGFPLILFNNRLVRKERKDFQAEPRDLEVIKKFNAIDLAVYRIAKEDFDQRVADIWNAECDDLYRKFLSALEQFRRETGGDLNRTEVFKR